MVGLPTQGAQCNGCVNAVGTVRPLREPIGPGRVAQSSRVPALGSSPSDSSSQPAISVDPPHGASADEAPASARASSAPAKAIVPIAISRRPPRADRVAGPLPETARTAP